MNRNSSCSYDTYSQEGETDSKVLNHYIYKMSRAVNKNKAEKEDRFWGCCFR